MMMKEMSEDSEVKDALSAEVIVRAELEARFGRNKISRVTVHRAELVSSESSEFWEAEGDIVLKLGLASKQIKHFKYCIDADLKRIVRFEII